jgi:hypothetical protein
MSNEIFASDMFVDVTEEQQQMVAGGGGYDYGKYFPGFKEVAKSDFSQAFKSFTLKTATFADAKGAGTMKELSTEQAKVDASALEKIHIYPWHY